MTIHEEYQRRAAELYGLRPSTAVICPRVVAGKRCRAYTDQHADQHAESECLCQRHRRTLDHGRIWLDTNHHHVLTGEPYEIGGEEIADLTTDMTELGLTVTITGRSIWNPGHTLLVRITRERN